MTPTLVLLAGAVCLGAILGSFLNALSFRFNTGRSIFLEGSSTGLRASRSRCMRCSHELGALDLVPVLSFLFLRGRCRWCRSRISWQYPMVELAAAILAGLIYTQHPAPWAFIFWLLVWLTLMFVVIYDVRHTIIPWSCSGLLALLALFALVYHHAGPLSLAAGPLLALPLFLLSLISWGRWMGWGDSALELSLGWFLGLTSGLTALVCAFWIGAVAGVALIALSRLGIFSGVTMKSELPFAPFLIVGAALAFFGHVDIFQALPLFFQ